MLSSSATFVLTLLFSVFNLVSAAQYTGGYIGGGIGGLVSALYEQQCRIQLPNLLDHPHSRRDCHRRYSSFLAWHRRQAALDSTDHLFPHRR